LARIAGCAKPDSGTTARPPVPVLAAKAIEKSIPNQLHEIGTVEAFSTVKIKARVEGALIAVHFKEGDYVANGQLLFNLDPRVPQAVLRQAEANLARDTAQAEQAETDEKRYAFLLKEGVGSRQQYDQAHATAGALRATTAADRASIESARLNLQYTVIRSPIDGRTGNLQSHVGDLIKADADTPMVVINQVQPIYVDFSIPEASLAQVRINMDLHRLEVDAAIQGSQDVSEHGVLSFVDNAVDTNTGTILLKGLFQNENRRLWPGQFVNASLTLNQIAKAIVVPSQAIQSGQQGPFIFVAGSDMKVEPRPVVPGAALDNNETIIERGIVAGETVVTDGQLRLAPGARVRIKNSL
jgi:multidrug efflux system membrane fusion protein